MRTFEQILAGCFVAYAICACHPAEKESTVKSPEEIDLEQKVGQLMMVGFKGTELTPSIREALCKLQPGGVCLYAQNITGPAQVANLNEKLRSCLRNNGIPPFLAVDQEGGTVVRIDNGVTVFPGAMALGATRSVSLAGKAGCVQGRELRLLGFNMNLAPVLDIPDNPAIATRSFSDQPELIAKLGRAYVQGQQEANIATVAKHFPGEGHSHTDSHHGLPVRREPGDVLREELSPFCQVIQGGLDGLMTAHVGVPTLTGDYFPATMSRPLLTGLLREEIGFDGLILTDELEGMRSVSRYGVDRAAVAAIKGGADMVFVAFSEKTQLQVKSALIKAARSGDIPAARLNQAFQTILGLKFKRRIFDELDPVDQRLAKLSHDEGRDVAVEIARKSLTCFRADPNLLPLNPDSRIGIISDSQNLVHAIRQWSPRAQAIMIDSNALKKKRVLRGQIRRLAKDSAVLIAGFIYGNRLSLVTDARGTGCPLIVILMNVPGPGVADEIPEAKEILETYSYEPVAVQAGAAALFGAGQMPGISPVQTAPRGQARITTAKLP